jgi:DHA2 family multidrug resistance protein-like MFS transporter
MIATGATTHPVSPAKAGRKEWVALAVLALPLLLVSMDVSVLYFAVPFISRDLSASATQQLWIFDIYGFVLAGLLITMGSLGDRIGRRRLLVLGAAAFGLASVAAAYAQSPAELIAARALLGIGGATLMPSTLALIRNMFHDPAQRAKAVAVWSAVMMGGISIGPVLSGVLLEHFWWGSVFLINLPAMALLLVLAPVLLPEFRNPAAGGFDRLGSVLSLGAILPAVYGIKHAATDGFGPLAAGCLVVGLIVGWAFIARQHRATDPMIDLRLFANPAFRGSLLANTVATLALVGNAVFMTQYLQLVVGMSPLRAALWSLLPSVGVAVAAPTANSLGQRLGRGRVMGGAFLVGAMGFAVLTQVRVGSPLVLVIIGAGVLASGLVGVLTLVTDVVLGTVSPERAGAASALMETCGELGGALGIALLGSIGAAVYGHRIGEHLPAGLSTAEADRARQGIAGAMAAGGHLPVPIASRLVAAARVAFTSGLDVVAVVGGVMLVATALASVLLLRSSD